MSNKLFKDDTGQAINTTLTALKNVIENKSTDVPAWVTAALALPTAQKTALKSAIYEVLGLNNSAQTSAQALPDIYSILDLTVDENNGAALHSMLPRGKNLGSSLTATQIANIANGTFKDLWVNDYWQKSITFSYLDANNDDASKTVTTTVRMYVAHPNYRLNCGIWMLTTNHILVVPAAQLFAAPMNKGQNITTGGYMGSEMKTKYLDGAMNAFKAFFGEAHILKHSNIFVNTVKDGYPSSSGWFDTYIDLMNEPMVYGSYHMTPGSNGVIVPYRYTIDKQQIALFRNNPSLISTRNDWWLRDVVSATYFAGVYGAGDSDDLIASNVYGVRPAALIY